MFWTARLWDSLPAKVTVQLNSKSRLWKCGVLTSILKGLQLLFTAVDKIIISGSCDRLLWFRKGGGQRGGGALAPAPGHCNLAKTAKRSSLQPHLLLGSVSLIRLSCFNGRVPNAPRSVTETVTLRKLRCFSLLARRRAICEPEHERWRCRRSPHGVGSRIGSSSSQSPLSPCRCTNSQKVVKSDKVHYSLASTLSFKTPPSATPPASY